MLGEPATLNVTRNADRDPRRRRQRHRQDDDDRQARLEAPRARAERDPRRRRHVPRRGRGAARDLGEARRRRTSSAPCAGPILPRSRTTPSRRRSARGRDVVIVDTAGRLHTQANLMEELAKVRRVIEGARRRAARDAARRRRHHGPERGAAGAAVRRGGRRDGRRADEARRLGQGRIAVAIAHELGAAGEARRRGGRARRPAAVRPGGLRASIDRELAVAD